MAGTQDPPPVPVGISACLLGQQVRYNGGHKYDEFCVQVLGRVFRYVSCCPEVSIGMGVPREPIRLVGDAEQRRALGVASENLDVTASLKAFADDCRIQVELLRGYIFMQRSPSCALDSANIYNPQGALVGKGPGLFAGRLRKHFPLLPMEEAARLSDPVLRENFVARVYLYARWMRLVEEGITPHKLVAFHSQHKYFVMSFGQKLYRELGALVARAGRDPIPVLAEDYAAQLMTGTCKPPSRKSHVNVLYHMAGYLREVAPGGTPAVLISAIESYRTRQAPLSTPIELLQHYLDLYGGDYIRQQVYLNPYPGELNLRSGI